MSTCFVKFSHFHQLLPFRIQSIQDEMINLDFLVVALQRIKCLIGILISVVEIGYDNFEDLRISYGYGVMDTVIVILSPGLVEFAVWKIEFKNNRIMI